MDGKVVCNPNGYSEEGYAGPVRDRITRESFLVVHGDGRLSAKQPVMGNEVRELLVQADAAIEKSRGLLRRAVSALVRGAKPSDIGVEDLLAEINDLLGD